MKNLQVRLGADEARGLDELASDLRFSRSETVRHLLREGMRRARMERALARYIAHEFTLSRAAEYAGVGIYEMCRMAAERGVPFFRYGVDELERDIGVLEKTRRLAHGKKRSRRRVRA